MTVQKIIKVGNSLGIILPSKYLQALSLKKGDSLSLALDANQIICSIEDQHQLSLLQTTVSHQPKAKGI